MCWKGSWCLRVWSTGLKGLRGLVAVLGFGFRAVLGDTVGHCMLGPEGLLQRYLGPRQFPMKVLGTLTFGDGLCSVGA